MSKQSAKRVKRRKMREAEFGPEREVKYTFTHDGQELEHLECGHDIPSPGLTGTVGKQLLRRCPACRRKVRVRVFNAMPSR